MVPDGYKAGQERVLEGMKLKYLDADYFNYCRYPLPGYYGRDTIPLRSKGAGEFSKILLSKINRINEGVNYDD
jgi:hypothetical protein